jgi:tetratricopeptide (TPR) repeat protein
MIIIEEFSQKVKKELIQIIQNEKIKRDNQIQKIADQCIKILQHEILRVELLEISLEYIKTQMKGKGDPFYFLLLAFLYENLEEEEQSMLYLKKYSDSLSDVSFKEELNDFMLYTRFFEWGEFQLLEEVGLSMINKYSGEETISNVLWMLTEYAEMAEYTDTYLLLANKAQELYPEVFRLNSFLGRLFNHTENYEKALNAYINYKNGVEKDEDNPIYNCELANAWATIANAYIKLDDPENAITSSNSALKYDMESEDFKIENYILCNRAKAYLMQNNKDLASIDINKVLASDPEDENALKVQEEIKNKN